MMNIDRKSYCLCGQPYDPNRFMIQCDACKDWFHSSCCNFQEVLVPEVDKFYCPQCSRLFGPSVFKSVRNWHRHDYWEMNADHKPVQTGTTMFIRELQTRHFTDDSNVVVHIKGQQLTLNYVRMNGFNTPIVVDTRDGLDLRLPPESISLYEIQRMVGSNLEIGVIDVVRQTEVKMKVCDYVDYYYGLNRNKVYNVISLEFSNTQLAQLVEPPLLARQLDWVNTAWPADYLHGKPQVSKYCVMSVKDAFTDFHIDFGGSTVWYHVLRGEKVFYLIQPTSANLTLYSQWMTSSTQSETFFGDQVDQCVKCVLRQGQTMFIPTGWIHAVLTPIDSVVFGGNFLHELNIPMQLTVYEIEKKTRADGKFKYPNFELINWFAGQKMLTELRQINGQELIVPQTLLVNVKSMMTSLRHWNSEKDYNMTVREQIPHTIRPQELLKDLSKEIRHAERFINHLNPPKPERESTRKRKKPMNLDFVVFSGVTVKTPTTTSQIAASTSVFNSTMAFPQSKPRPTVSPIRISIPKNSDNKSYQVQSKSNPTTSSTSKKKENCGTPKKSRSPRTVINQSKTSPISVSPQRSGTVLKFRLGSKEVMTTQLRTNLRMPIVTPVSPTITPTNSKSIYDFHDESSEQDDDNYGFTIDERPTLMKNSKMRKSGGTKITINNNNNNNGANITLAPSTISNAAAKRQQSRQKTKKITTSMSNNNAMFTPSTSGYNDINSVVDDELMPAYDSSVDSNILEFPEAYLPASGQFSFGSLEDVSNLHQDEDYIYPSLDNSEDEEDDEVHVFKSRGRNKIDEAWNPKAKVGPLQPKMDRPAREGTKKQSVEKVLEATAAKRANEKEKKPQNRSRKLVTTTANKLPSDNQTVIVAGPLFGQQPMEVLPAAVPEATTATPKPKKFFGATATATILIPSEESSTATAKATQPRKLMATPRRRPKTNAVATVTATFGDISTLSVADGSSSLGQTNITSATTRHPPRQRKGMKTVKQRLGKILKIHKMIH